MSRRPRRNPFLPLASAVLNALVDGSPFLPIPGSEAAQQSTEDRHAFTGSFMIFVADDIEQVWARIKADVYWENNVWDKEKVAVHPLLK
jgi:hypothetical protein